MALPRFPGGHSAIRPGSLHPKVGAGQFAPGFCTPRLVLDKSLRDFANNGCKFYRVSVRTLVETNFTPQFPRGFVFIRFQGYELYESSWGNCFDAFPGGELYKLSLSVSGWMQVVPNCGSNFTVNLYQMFVLQGSSCLGC